MRMMSKTTRSVKKNSKNQMDQIENFSILIHEGVMLNFKQIMMLIDSIYYDVRDKRDEIIERTSVYKKNLVVSMTDSRYHEAVAINREISQFRLELMKISSLVLMAIDCVLSKTDISSLQFLLSQKEYFDQYCKALENYLSAYFGNEDCDLEEKGQIVFEFKEAIVNGNREYIKK